MAEKGVRALDVDYYDTFSSSEGKRVLKDLERQVASNDEGAPPKDPYGPVWKDGFRNMLSNIKFRIARERQRRKEGVEEDEE